MEPTTKQVMYNTLHPQVTVKKIHQIIVEANIGENPIYNGWLENTIDTADVNTNIEDYTDKGVIDYDGYYRAVYNEVKQFIQNRLNYAVDQWKTINQVIVQ